MSARSNAASSPRGLRPSVTARGAVVLAAFMFVQVHADADVLPNNLLFVGLAQGEWRLFVGDGSASPRRIPTASEPRTPAYSAGRNRIAYISSSGALHEIDMASGADRTLLNPSKDAAYTQPAYRPGTDQIYLVSLRDSSSVETDIVRLDRASGKAIPVLRQRSAQFEPSFTADGARMFYSNVLCASECPKIIQEIWAMDVVGGVAEQITLLNSVSRQAVADGDGGVVFASNKGGRYQLWRSSAPGAATERLTQESAIDESPAVDSGGAVYFIRRTAAGGRLMRMEGPGKVREIALPDPIRDIRDVRWGR